MVVVEATPYVPYEIEFETLEQGVRRGWAFDRRIVVFVVPSLHRDALDVWAANVIETADQWPEDQPILIIHDLTAFGNYASVTPYIRKKSEDIVAAAPHMRGRSAVVVQNTVFLRAISLFLNYLNRNGQPNMEIRVLTDLREAWHWLTAGLLES